MDIGARAGFPGEFVDLTPLIAAAGFGLSQYPANLLDAMKDGRTGALLGLPYGVIPVGHLLQQGPLRPGRPEVPTTEGWRPYTMPDGSKVPWNWDTVRAVAMKLSLDTNGKNATQAGFDPTKQAQFGFEFQAADGLAVAKAFGQRFVPWLGRQDRPVPRRLEGSLDLVLRRHLERPLHRQRQRTRLGRPGGSDPVHVLLPLVRRSCCQRQAQALGTSRSCRRTHRA